MLLLFVLMTADWSAILFVHRRHPPSSSHSVTLRQFAGTAVACRQPVFGYLQPTVRTNACLPGSCRALHRRRMDNVGYCSCATGAAHADATLQR